MRVRTFMLEWPKEYQGIWWTMERFRVGTVRETMVKRSCTQRCFLHFSSCHITPSCRLLTENCDSYRGRPRVDLAWWLDRAACTLEESEDWVLPNAAGWAAASSPSARGAPAPDETLYCSEPEEEEGSLAARGEVAAARAVGRGEAEAAEEVEEREEEEAA